jgi:hypothetical protein
MAKKNNEELVAGIAVAIIVVVVGFALFVLNSSDSTDETIESQPNVEFTTEDVIDSDSNIYECSSEVQLGSFISGCEDGSVIIELIDPNTSKVIAEIDYLKLINSCDTGLCEDMPIDFDADYMSINEGENSTYSSLFSSKPSEAELDEAIDHLFKEFSLNINDQFLFGVIGSDQEPLALKFQYVPLSATIVNNEKTAHKVVQISLGVVQEEEDLIEFGLNTMTYSPFVSGAELKLELNSYFNALDPITSTYSYTDFRGEVAEYINELPSEVSDTIVFVNENVDYPTVYSSGGSPYTVDERSCNAWKDIAYKRNSAYSACMATDGENCGVTYTIYYENYWWYKFKEVKLSEVAPNTEVVKLFTDSWEGSTCYDELENISDLLF